MPRGGYRLGAGRPKGAKNKKTLEKKIIDEELKRRVIQKADALLNAQLSVAIGCSYLFKVEKNRKKPVMIKDPKIISDYLGGELDDRYYYITTEEPNWRAVVSLFDRVFGRPKEMTDDDSEIDYYHQLTNEQLDRQIEEIKQELSRINNTQQGAKHN